MNQYDILLIMSFFLNHQPKFAGCYCDGTTSAEYEIICHAMNRHLENNYRARVLEINRDTGKIGYRKKYSNSIQGT